MGKGDLFWRVHEKRAALEEAEAAGQVSDSMEVRTALMARMERGELTLEQVQAELARIKREGRKAGKLTRDEAYRRG